MFLNSCFRFVLAGFGGFVPVVLLFDERNLLDSSQLSTEDVVFVHARDVTPLQLQEVVQLRTNASLVVVVVSEAHLLTSLASMDVPVLTLESLCPTASVGRVGRTSVESAVAHVVTQTKRHQLLLITQQSFRKFRLQKNLSKLSSVFILALVITISVRHSVNL